MTDTTNTPNTYASLAVVRVNMIKPDFKSGNMGGKYFSHVCYAIWNFEAYEIVTALANHNRGVTYGYITEDGHLSRELTVDPEPTPEPELPIPTPTPLQVELLEALDAYDGVPADTTGGSQIR